MSINKLRKFTKYFNDFYCGEDSIYNLTNKRVTENEIIKGLEVLKETARTFIDDSITREQLRYVIFEGLSKEDSYKKGFYE